MKRLIIVPLILVSGCGYRIVTVQRDELVAKQLANIHEAATAQEAGVPVELTSPRIRKACKAALKVLGYHLEVDDE